MSEGIKRITIGRSNIGGQPMPPALPLVEEKYIQSLQARIKELEEQNRWIPVGERLPEGERGELALLFNEKTGEVKVWTWADLDDEFRFILLDGFTHWRPINPPKERN